MRSNERAENFDAKYEKFDDVVIITREYKKRFAVNRRENIYIPDIDIPGGKANKSNKKDTF